MNDMEQSDNLDSEKHGNYYALLVAFKTMNERCQQLETRLATVEEENMCLRLECTKNESADIMKVDDNEKAIAQTLKVCITYMLMLRMYIYHILIYYTSM